MLLARADSLFTIISSSIVTFFCAYLIMIQFYLEINNKPVTLTKIILLDLNQNIEKFSIDKHNTLKGKLHNTGKF